MRLGLVALLLLASAGCEWIWNGDSPHFTDQVPITAPWSGWSLPVSEGKVTYSDGETLSVHHTGTSEALATAYGAALDGAGWSLDADTSAGDIVNQTWSKDADTLALSVQQAEGTAIVSLSRLPF